MKKIKKTIAVNNGYLRLIVMKKQITRLIQLNPKP